MNTVTPVTITTPDGVERQLRFTLGARKRIFEQFGSDMRTVLNTHGDAALPDILYALLFDTKGKAPDLPLEELRESLPLDSANELLAAIMSAATQGRTPKNEIEDLLNKASEMEAAKIMEQLIGWNSGASVPRSSASETVSSGGDTSNAKSSPELIDSMSTSESETTVPV